MPTAGGRIRVTLAGEGAGPAETYPPLRPGIAHQLPLEVPGHELPGNQEVIFEVTLSPRGSDAATAADIVRHVPVARAKQFVERTRDQAAFEDICAFMRQHNFRLIDIGEPIRARDTDEVLYFDVAFLNDCAVAAAPSDNDRARK